MMSKQDLFEGSDGMRQLLDLVESNSEDVVNDLHAWAGETSIGDLQQDMSDQEILNQIKAMSYQGDSGSSSLESYSDEEILSGLQKIRTSVGENKVEEDNLPEPSIIHALNHLIDQSEQKFGKDDPIVSWFRSEIHAIQDVSDEQGRLE